MTKAELRKAALAQRDALAKPQRELAAQAVAQRLRAMPIWQRAQVLLSTMAFGSELDLAALHQEWLQRGRVLVLPRMAPPAKALELRLVTDLQHQLSPGRWGIREPQPAHCPLVDPGRIDLVLVPGLAFDRRGNRLGYGAGYYDRILQSLPRAAWRVACAFDGAVLADVPTQDHDQPVDLLITPSMTWLCGPLPAR